jgi:electron transfer flavoprotein alpha subunit
MSGILVIAEHRKGNMMDVSWEMLTKGAELAASSGNELTVVLAGANVRNLAEKLAQKAPKVWLLDSPKLENYNSEIYCEVLGNLIKENKRS